MRWVAPSMALGLAVGCTAQIGSGEERLSHEQHEMTVTPADVTTLWEREGDWLVSPELDAPDGASRVGVLLGLLEPGEMPALEAQGMLDGEPVGDWQPLTATWSEEDHHVAIAELGGIGSSARLRIAASASERLAHFRWTAVIPEELDVAIEGEDLEGDVGAASEALRSELRGLGIVTRSSWGARATRCTSQNASKSRMAIHHTVTGADNPARQMRAIQNFHMDSRGWCDVGYHFLVGQDGTLYEGRPLHLLGAHVGGHNTGNIGISFIGCFNSSGCGGLSGSRTPSSASIGAAARLVRALSDLYGIAINTDRVKGHGEHSGQSTSCPGSNLRSRLGDLRTRARSGGTTPTPTPTPTPSGGSCTHSYGGTYADNACSAGWQCCDGRWRDRGACGACACVEETGRVGCSAPSGPPPGSACTHSYGGRYANTACSAAWQCCDGTWRTRGACGGCYCVEESGTRGCGT